MRHPVSPRVGLAAATAAVVAFRTTPLAIRRAPSGLRRVNYRGRSAPAVLAVPLVAGALSGLGALSVIRSKPRGTSSEATARTTVGGLVGLMMLAGLADDLRGDEASRGFRGHLGALAEGRVTGGVVKIAAGAAGGLAAGRVHHRGWGVVETGALVALAANLANLLDRAPGRAAKMSLAAAAPMSALGSQAWATATVPLWAALTACLPVDLSESAMLGDAGANPLGASLGLGLALSLDRRGRLVALAALAALNLASERWSFSEVIDRTPLLGAIDRLGRRVKSGPIVLA